jgi:gluconokinase
MPELIPLMALSKGNPRPGTFVLFLTPLGQRYPMQCAIVIMGVAGCGKSSLAAAVAKAEGLALVEGDDHHSDSSRRKMSQGIPLTDADRDGWLERLGAELARHPAGLVLTCSALKHTYRERLRRAAPGLHFVFMEIGRDDALARVAERAPRHFFSSSLVDSQFATLEPPLGEPRVLRVDALAPLDELQSRVSAWLRQENRHD